MQEFFTPLSKDLIAYRQILQEGMLGKKIPAYTKKNDFPELHTLKFALFGVKECRSSETQTDCKPNFDGVRKSLYSLYEGNWQHTIGDLGDIQAGETVEDTYFAVKMIVNDLLKNKIIPIVLGGSQDLVYPVYRGYDDLGKMINYVNIDSMFDIGNAENIISNKSYVGKMVVDQPYNLFNYSVVGYQTYFNNSHEIHLLEKLYFEAYRLGEIINDITLVETITREADFVSLDISAIKSSELSYIGTISPNGFDGREICAISRYAGISDRVSCFGIFEINNLHKESAATMLIAQIIWYFVEGVNCRIDEGDIASSKDFTTYKVPVYDEILTFKKSLKTERWWMEMSFISENNNNFKTNSLLPCTYQDYESACNQEIPERWYRAKRKNQL